MLGESGLDQRMVTQAAWIRSLVATYIKSWEGRRSTGGLFGALSGSNEGVLPWSRAQQAAFLIFMGQKVRDSIMGSEEAWVFNLQQIADEEDEEDVKSAGFAGPYTLLNTDQGIRGLLFVTNGLSWARAAELRLEDWVTEGSADATDEEEVYQALESLKETDIAKFLERVADSLASFDWRTSRTPALSEPLRGRKAAYRGSGGYRELRVDLLRHLSRESNEVGETAAKVMEVMGYE